MMRLRWASVVSESQKDCGPAALATVALHYGVRRSLLELHDLLGTDAQGTSLTALQAGAEQIGFTASCGTLRGQHLSHVGLPLIAHCVHQGSGHYVVVHKVTSDSVIVADPLRGVVTKSLHQFSSEWTNQVLLLRPSPRWRSPGVSGQLFWQFVRLARSERDLLMLSAWFAVVLAATAYALSFFVSQIVDRVLPASNSDLLRSLGVGFLVVVVVRTVFALVRQLLLTRVNLRLSLSLGSAYAQHLLSLPVRFFDSHQSGELLARFADAPKVSAALSGPILAVALDLLLLFICGSFMFWYSASLTCLTMGFVPAYAVITLWANAAVRHRERRIREAFGALSNLFVELMANIRIVKAYTVEGVANEQLAVAHDTMQRAVMDRATLNIGLVAASTLLSGVTSVALLWVGAGLVMERQLTVGQLMFFFSASTLFMASVDRLGASVAAIQEAAIGLERVNDVRALPQEHEGALLGFGASDRCESIEFRNVGFGYRPNRMVLHDINLRIRAGMTVAVLGETGSGKSSLVSLVNGLYQPQQGQVLVNGRDVRDIDKVALRRRMAVVVQEPGLMSGTIRQNIGLGSTGSDEQVEKAARLACADKFIRDLPGGYDYEVGLAGVGLSCGQRQRIAIARALFRDPAVLILDEATSNLDPETERDVVDALDLGSAARMTIIATHRIAIAARAHHVIVLDDGRIVESGSHAQLLTQKGKYHAMWSTLTPMIGAPSCVE